MNKEKPITPKNNKIYPWNSSFICPKCGQNIEWAAEDGFCEYWYGGCCSQSFIMSPETISMSIYIE